MEAVVAIRIKRSRKMVFTINNPSSGLIQKHEAMPWRSDCTHFVCQLEAGAVAGVDHLQGFVRWRHAKTFTAAMKILGKGHFEGARGSIKSNKVYCTKIATRIAGPWLWGFAVQRPLPERLYPWQDATVALLREPINDRTIFWVWEPEGCSGKSVLQHVLARDFEAILVGNSPRDAACAIKLAWFDDDDADARAPPIPIVMLNLARDTQNPRLWPLLECIKDGILFSGKYKSQMIRMPLTHLIVFANEPPEACSLSVDKLCVFRIQRDTRIMYKAGYNTGLFRAPFYGPGF